MNIEKKLHSRWLMLITFVVFAVAMLIFYWISSSGFSVADAKKSVVGSSSVQAEELQDENGKFIILDYPEYDVDAYVTLGDYKNMTVTPVAFPEVTDEDIQQNVESYITYYGRYDQASEGMIQKGDILTLSYTGYLDGKSVDGYTAKDNVIMLGSAGEPEGFVEALDGAACGEDLEFDVTFPDDWDEEAYAGKVMQFKVHVSFINTIPELTDESVGRITDGEYETADEFRAYIKERLEEYDQAEYENELCNEIFDALAADAKFKSVPHDLLVWNVSMQMKYYQDCADAYGMTVEEYIADAGVADSLDDMLYMMTETASENVRQYALLDAVAKAEGLVLDESDEESLQFRKDQLIEGLGLSGEDALMTYYKESNVRNDVLNWKTLDWLMAHVVQTESQTGE